MPVVIPEHIKQRVMESFDRIDRFVSKIENEIKDIRINRPDILDFIHKDEDTRMLYNRAELVLNVWGFVRDYMENFMNGNLEDAISITEHLEIFEEDMRIIKGVLRTIYNKYADEYGHMTGNELLIRMYSVLSDVVGAVDRGVIDGLSARVYMALKKIGDVCECKQ